MPFDIAGALGAGYSSDEIIKHLKDHPDDADGFKIDEALKHYSPDEIVDHLNPKADKLNVQGIPILAPIDRGIAHLREQTANLATDLGATNVGSFIRQSIPQATLHAKTAGQSLSEDLGNRQYLSALSNLPSAALEQAAPLAGSLVAGAASGGSIPAVLGAGAAIGAVTQGDAIARQRAANNGRTEGPSAGDMALGVLGGAATGAVGSVGLGGIAGRGVAGALRATGLHGASDAAQPEMASLAGSVGTDAGTQNATVPDTAAAALTGLATRGALAAPGIVRDLSPAGRQPTLSDRFSAMSPEDQATTRNTAAAGDLVARTKADALPGLSEPTPATISKSAGAALDARMGGLVSEMDRQGVLTDGAARTIAEAHRAAADPSLLLSRDHLAAIDGLGLDQDTTNVLKDSLQQRNLVANSGNPSSMPGVAGAAGGLVRSVVGGVLPPVVSRVAGAALGPLGEAVAARFGLTDPPLIKAAANAAKMLQAAGEQVPNTMAGLQNAMSRTRNVIETQQRLMDAQKAQDTAAAQMFKTDYGDAQVMNRAMDRNATFQRAQEIGDAQAMDRQRTQGLNFQRAQDVGNAQAIDAQRTRGTNLLEAQGGPVAMMAYNRMLAQKALEGTPTVEAARATPMPDQGQPSPTAPPTAPNEPQVSPVVQAAIQRASASNPDPMTAIVPGTAGVRPDVLTAGEHLPEWQFSLGRKLLEELNLRGTPKNLNVPEEVANAVQGLRDRGAFSDDFHEQLMAHRGHLVKGIYDAVRHEMFARHGIENRNLDVQRQQQP